MVQFPCPFPADSRGGEDGAVGDAGGGVGDVGGGGAAEVDVGVGGSGVDANGGVDHHQSGKMQSCPVREDPETRVIQFHSIAEICCASAWLIAVLIEKALSTIGVT